MKAVTSRDNAAFKAMAKLAASAAERKRRALSVLEGAHLLGAYLDSGRHPEEVMVTREGLADAEIAQLVDRSAAARVTLVAESLFRALSSVKSPGGVIAAAATPQPQPVPAGAELVLLLEGIQDPGNVGTLLRSAAAAGAGHVLLSEHCAFAWSPKVLRAAMGAHFALNIVEGADLVGFITGYHGASVALTAQASASIFDLDLSGPAALLVGNEGAGLSEALLAQAGFRARIPMPGRMESLNAATAGSIVLFEAVRQKARR